MTDILYLWLDQWECLGRCNEMRAVVVLLVLIVALASGAALPFAAQRETPDLTLFFAATSPELAKASKALETIGDSWQNGYAAIIWDIVRMLPGPGPVITGPGSAAVAVQLRLIKFLEEQTGRNFGQDLYAWHDWIWNQPYDPHPDYAIFKGIWYGQIDERFSDFFASGNRATIRFDEIDWGGVRVNGIPPLEYALVLPAEDADYLDESDIVFGLSVNGETRAYPKRILAWHEMALDQLGGVELTVVYCTLCGTVIPFESVIGGRHIRFGTSGLLYRSNKLMFDQGTKSLWSTFEGVPVVGPLVGSDLKLTHRPVVTTTWGEWRTQHPETTVLSLDTGHQRDYSEGAAYRDYFATDQLMFEVPEHDDRLLNKNEVLVLHAGIGGLARPLAIAAAFLTENRIYEIDQADANLVVITSPGGANRVFERGAERFTQIVTLNRVADTAGRTWRVDEDALVLEVDPTVTRARLSAQRAFWFGWRAQFPDTLLIR
jgi:hypothetical protein